MKTLVWLGLVFSFLTPRTPARAQSLAGVWQGVEMAPGSYTSETWASVLTLRAGKTALTGELYQVASGMPEFTGTFRMRGLRTATGLRLRHAGIVAETHPQDSYWCLGTITFTYDAALEKLTGRAVFPPDQECGHSQYELYRVRLKSAPTVPVATLGTLHVSGRNVRWFADPELRRALASGNSYRTKLRKTTTFYLTQGFYPTDRSPVVPVTVRVRGPARPVPAAPLAAPPAAPPPRQPALAPETAASPIPTPPAPAVLPTVLFKLTTAELLPESGPTLDQLATTLRARPALRIRVAGHTDRLGESTKNQLLSEQRAAAVKSYLMRAGVAAGRIETVGYGDTRPLYPSPDARNRRVEVEELK